MPREWARQDSNLDSADYESDALTVKLRALVGIFYWLGGVRSMLTLTQTGLVAANPASNLLFCVVERVIGFEPMQTPWKGVVLPLHHTRITEKYTTKSGHF